MANSIGPRSYTITVEGKAYQVQVDEGGESSKSLTHKPAEYTPADNTASQVLEAPTPGNIVRLDVKPGDQVTLNQTLLVMEAMKMESEVKAPCPGTVGEVYVATGETVQSGDALLSISN